MPRLGISIEFLAEYRKLQKQVQNAVDQAITKFGEHTHAGLHLEKIRNARDARIRTIRIDRFWRGVVLAPDHGDEYCLLTVLPHDDALAYAASRRFSVNSALGVLEVRNEQALEAITPALQSVAHGTDDRLVGDISDADLLRLGIDGTLIPLIRLLTADAHLDALQLIIPSNQYDILVALAAGMSPDETWQQVAAAQLVDPRPPTEVDTDDLGAAMERSQGRIAMVSGPEELLNILAKPFDAWRVFLHPSQHRIAYRPTYGGPAQVAGGPGTGKTVVALHRVSHLVRRLAEGERILLTTYTKALASHLSDSLALLLDAELLARVEVVHVDSLANRIVRSSRGTRPLVIEADQEERMRWGRVIRRLGLPWSEPFLAQEYRHVILAQGIARKEEYLAAIREGRGTRLGTAQRERVWCAIEQFSQGLVEANAMTHLQVADEAARLLSAETGHRFRHVVIDEAQDLHPVQWRLLRACVAQGADDLFIAGDPHQRIYDNRVSLRSLGIKVTGRSSRLRINYRTTHEILTWSTQLLTGEHFTGLAGAEESSPQVMPPGGDENLAGYQSALHGMRPTLAPHVDRVHELAALVDRVQRWIDEGISPQDIAVAGRHRKGLLDLVGERLKAAKIMTADLGGEVAKKPGAVGIGTMHAMKGLEFRCVAVVGVNERVVPMANAITPRDIDRLQHEADLLAERCLLFVACTRAREALYVSWSGAPSPFLPVGRQDAGA